MVNGNYAVRWQWAFDRANMEDEGVAEDRQGRRRSSVTKLVFVVASGYARCWLGGSSSEVGRGRAATAT